MKAYAKSILLIFLLLTLSAEAREITDRIGRKVVLPDKINRIITIGSVPVVNSLMMTLGEQGKIVNDLPAWANSSKRWHYQYIFAPNIKNKVVVQGNNSELDIEKIIKAKPDVVFTLTFFRHMVGVLASKGIKVVVLQWDDASDVKPTMELLGKILNKEKQANEYIEYFNKTVAKAYDISKQIPKDKKTRVLYTRFYNMTQPVKIADWWIKMAGGISVTAAKREVNSLSYDSEQLLAWNPDLIITFSQRGLKMLRTDKRFASLKAIKNKQTYTPPMVAMPWGQPTVEQPLMVLWALNTIYPKLYSKQDLKKEMSYFYEHFFKVKLSEKQIADILATNKGF